MVVPNIYVSLVWNLLQVTLLATTILKWLKFFWKICALLSRSIPVLFFMGVHYVIGHWILTQCTLEPYIPLQHNGGVTQLRNGSDLPSAKQEPVASPPD